MILNNSYDIKNFVLFFKTISEISSHLNIHSVAHFIYLLLSRKIESSVERLALEVLLIIYVFVLWCKLWINIYLIFIVLRNLLFYSRLICMIRIQFKYDKIFSSKPLTQTWWTFLYIRKLQYYYLTVSCRRLETSRRFLNINLSYFYYIFQFYQKHGNTIKIFFTTKYCLKVR